MIKIPLYIEKILNELNNVDHEAYVVGGCVRDSLIGVEPLDWDVCTSAIPQQIINTFSKNYTVIPTGLKHGTITVISEKNPVEITTYRCDGKYSDNRHPEEVKFIKSIEEDLARRDFTINAIAYHPKKGIVDLYGGREDINKKIIRCVGIPERRFEEDALRIFRALRFAAVCNFEIDPKTEQAIFSKKNLVKNISVERILSETKKLLLADKPSDLIIKYKDILRFHIPISKNDNNITMIDTLPKDISLRTAALLGDLTDAEARKALRLLKADNNLTKNVCSILENKNIPIPQSKTDIKYLLRDVGLENTYRIFEYLKAQNKNIYTAITLLEEIIRNNECYSLGKLDLTGFDLIASGFESGKKIGAILTYLLDIVICEKVENKKAALLEAAKKYKL